MSLEAEVALGGSRCMASLRGRLLISPGGKGISSLSAGSSCLSPLPGRDIDHLATWSVLNVEQEVSESVLFDRSREGEDSALSFCLLDSVLSP